MRRRRLAVALCAVIVCAGAVEISPAVATRPPAQAHAAFAQQCSDPYSGRRNPANPLMLKHAPPASDPLAGAQFFVDGPAHGAAAGAIARLLGIDANVPVGQPLSHFRDSESWVRFSRYVARRLRHLKGATAYDIRMLEKIAIEPEAQRISKYSEGGSPAGIFGQAQKLFCHNFTADRHTIPIITTYFLHATLGGCPTLAQINAYRPAFEAQINALAQATGRRPVVYLLELDAVGSSACIAHAGLLPEWESLIRYEATTLGALPHTVVYIEGGYSDANGASYAAKVLNGAGVRTVEGFFTNDTHENWTISEIHYGEQISRLTGGAHFIVNTAENGRGPLKNPHPTTQGNDDLCNPPGRGLGPRPTTSTGYAHLDAFLWTFPPGNSSGSCGGGPPSGDFWAARAIGLAARANGKLGPEYPSAPY
jgi:endoglucanase